MHSGHDQGRRSRVLSRVQTDPSPQGQLHFQESHDGDGGGGLARGSQRRPHDQHPAVRAHPPPPPRALFTLFFFSLPFEYFLGFFLSRSPSLSPSPKYRYADRVKERGGKISLPIDHAKLQAGGDGEGGGGATLDMDDGDDEFQDGYEDNGDGGDGESDAGTNHEAEEQYAAVSEQLNEAEEHLLASHIGCVERNAVMCTEEGNLLASILDKDVVDYDIDE